MDIHHDLNNNNMSHISLTLYTVILIAKNMMLCFQDLKLINFPIGGDYA